MPVRWMPSTGTACHIENIIGNRDYTAWFGILERFALNVLSLAYGFLYLSFSKNSRAPTSLRFANLMCNEEKRNRACFCTVNMDLLHDLSLLSLASPAFTISILGVLMA